MCCVMTGRWLDMFSSSTDAMDANKLYLTKKKKNHEICLKYSYQYLGITVFSLRYSGTTCMIFGIHSKMPMEVILSDDDLMNYTYTA